MMKTVTVIAMMMTMMYASLSAILKQERHSTRKLPTIVSTNFEYYQLDCVDCVFMMFFVQGICSSSESEHKNNWQSVRSRYVNLQRKID